MPIKKKSSFLKQARKYIILSVIMMLIGGALERYKSEIYDYVTNHSQHHIEKVVNHAKDFIHSNIPDLSSSESEETFSSENKTARANSGYNKVIKHKYYTIGYNEDTEQPNWVSYNLTKKMILNTSAPRKENFRSDPYVSTGSAQLSDYRKSGYDRGHLCPAAAMRFSPEAMSETFYLSNMSPQVPGFNRGIWKNLEKKVREWAVKNDEISVVTGPIFYEGDKKEIGKNGVDVPNGYYKVILDRTEPDIKAIGFIMENKSTAQSVEKSAVTVDKVEEITGIDFFSGLPDYEEDRIESTADYDKWN